MFSERVLIVLRGYFAHERRLRRFILGASEHHRGHPAEDRRGLAVKDCYAGCDDKSLRRVPESRIRAQADGIEIHRRDKRWNIVEAGNFPKLKREVKLR